MPIRIRPGLLSAAPSLLLEQHLRVRKRHPADNAPPPGGKLLKSSGFMRDDGSIPYWASPKDYGALRAQAELFNSLPPGQTSTFRSASPLGR
jgi:hypothetical protein